MKKKTWILSALMYAAVFLACFGVLHVMDRLMEPGGNRPFESAGTPGNAAGAGDDGRTDGESEHSGELPALPATPSAAEAAEDWSRPDYRYDGWKTKLPGMWTPPREQEPEPPYAPPRLVLATDLHYQSALADDGGKAFNRFVERCDGKVVRYLPELLEAFMDEVIAEKPSALVLSGDIRCV